MPLIILCGQPSSGKSTVASALELQLSQSQKEVVVISEQTLHLDRNAAYGGTYRLSKNDKRLTATCPSTTSSADSASEKKLRGSLKATADRSLSKQTTVILDSINAIKGYRYELWCLARAAGTKYCVVHCDIPIQTSADWNAARDPSAAYSQAVFDDLTCRFERPDSRNRWDKPLYTIDTAAEDLDSIIENIVVSMTTAENAAGNRQQASSSSDLVPTSATSNPALSATNLLHEVDKAAQQVIAAVNDAQSAAAGGPAGQVTLGPSIQPLVLQEFVSMPELRRHKRAFIKLATQISNNRVQSAQDAKRMFADYLQTNLR